MPWRTMKLRGANVFARCDDSGQLLAEGGRVEVRYKRDDGRAYGASPRNLKPIADATVFEDGYCGPASAAPKREGSAKGSAAKGKTAKSGAKVAPPAAPSGNEVLVYCDGACSGNPGPAGLGVVMMWDDRRKVLSEYLGKGTNNIGELMAIQRAAEGMPDPSRPMRLFTDSTYAINMLTKGWKAKKNQALIADVKAALARLESVSLHYVKGHAGVPLNELADALAVQAVETRSSTGWQSDDR